MMPADLCCCVCIQKQDLQYNYIWRMFVDSCALFMLPDSEKDDQIQVVYKVYYKKLQRAIHFRQIYKYYWAISFH